MIEACFSATQTDLSALSHPTHHMCQMTNRMIDYPECNFKIRNDIDRLSCYPFLTGKSAWVTHLQITILLLLQMRILEAVSCRDENPKTADPISMTSCTAASVQVTWKVQDTSTGQNMGGGALIRSTHIFFYSLYRPLIATVATWMRQ